jgi:glycosyltransferase involved in cell wall biosynthesis
VLEKSHYHLYSEAMDKILFISHDASRTGAPILLFRLIQALSKSNQYEIIILLKNGGALKEKFSTLGLTFVWNEKIKITFLAKFLSKLGMHQLTAEARRKRVILNHVASADIVFNNTATNASLLKQLPLAHKRIFSYFHELSVVIDAITKAGDILYLESISEKIFIPALSLKNFYVDTFKIPVEKLELLKYIVPPVKMAIDSPNINPEGHNFLVGFAGTLNGRKGYDLIPLLAKKVIFDKRVSNIHFIWIGIDKTVMEFALFLSDLKRLRIQSYFTFIEPVDDINPFLSKLNLLVLPSREDPFPLVVLEAASHGVPTIGFKDAGGISDFIGDDAGVMIDYLDIDSMAISIANLGNDEALRKALGARAKERVKAYQNGEEIVKELSRYF